jgi:hypothetical protein
VDSDIALKGWCLVDTLIAADQKQHVGTNALPGKAVGIEVKGSVG